MKRPADFEGREESAGPLFDALRPVEQARRFLDFDVVVDPSLPPDTIACRDHTGRVVGRMVDVTPRALAEAKRDLGMSRSAHAAERRSPGWEVEACAQVMEYAKRHAHFATEDVRAVYGTPEGIDAKAWGPAMKRAARLGIVKADGFVLVNCSNRSPRTNWKSLVFEGSPKP